MTNEETKTEQKVEELKKEFTQGANEKVKEDTQKAKPQLLADNKKKLMLPSADKAIFLLAGLVFGIVISGFLGVDFSNNSTLGGKVLGTWDVSETETVIEKDGVTWVAFNDPVINTTVITRSDCETCDPIETIEVLKQNLIPTIKVEKIESDSEKAKKLIKDFNIKTIPAFIFDAKLAEAKNFEKASAVFQEKDGNYLLDSQKAGLRVGEYLEIPKASENDAQKGPADAAVTIIEISEFQCPYCSKAKTTVDELLELYPDDIKLVFKHLPLAFHENAPKAAEASECAGEQDKFWEMYDKLFDNQQSLEIADLKKYARELKINTSQFNECLDSGKYEEKVKKDSEEAAEFGISGTPAFFINKQFIGGAQPLEAFKKAVDIELSK
jgi:protein-disulfide isomerase